MQNLDFEQVWRHAASPPPFTRGLVDGVACGLTRREHEIMQQKKQQSLKDRQGVFALCWLQPDWVEALTRTPARKRMILEVERWVA
jgi:hypothetical protein